MQEDAIDILLNLKKVAFKLHGKDEVVLSLTKSTPGPVTAADFQPEHDVEIVNPDAVIANIAGNNQLSMKVRVVRGRGY